MNVHEVLGWNRCANIACATRLRSDHVTMTTTTQLRKFCSVECVVSGKAAFDAYVIDALRRGSDSNERETLAAYMLLNPPSAVWS